MAHARTALLLFFLLSPLFAAETLYLAPGHQQVLSFPGLTRAAIGNPVVADVAAVAGQEQVILTGLTRGSTNLLLWRRDGGKKAYNVVVSDASPSVEPDVRRSLKNIEGISVRTLRGRVVVEGEIYRGADFAKIDEVLRNYPAVVNRARANPQTLEYLATVATERLAREGFRNVTARADEDSLLLEGEVARKSDIQRAAKSVHPLYPKISNQLTVGLAAERLILVDVKMMEVRRNALGEIGVSWPGAIQAQGSLSATSGGTASSLTLGHDTPVTLHALMERGVAKLLSNPKLLCRNGTAASFVAGGEIPIRLVSERYARVEFKAYGLALDVKAKIDRSERISLDIHSRVSDLDPATTVDGIPGILQNEVRTAASLRLGETVVLAGLIEARARKNVRKMPFFGHIPILGELFKSRSFQNNESEFLVFLTPLPADPGIRLHEDQLRGMEKNTVQADRELHLSILD